MLRGHMSTYDTFLKVPLLFCAHPIACFQPTSFAQILDSISTNIENVAHGTELERKVADTPVN